MKALERLRCGESVFGMMQTYPDPALTEIALWCGYDFVLLDCEHGVVDEQAQLNVLRTIAGSHAFSLVRTRHGDQGEVARHFDFGVDGVVVPNVSTPAQAIEMAAARARWTGGLRADRYGLINPGSMAASPLLIVLIESPLGVKNVEAILDVEGVSGAMVGAGDLSMRFGKPGDFASTEFVAAVARVEQAVVARKKIMGGKIDATSRLSALQDRGYRLMIAGRDLAMIKNGFLEALTESKRES